MHSIFCLLEGEKNTFPVQIDETQYVGDLKDLIKTEQPISLATVDAEDLKLYHVNIAFDGSGEKNHIKQADGVFQDLNNHKPLSALRELSTFEKGFPPGELHILVQFPRMHKISCLLEGGVHPFSVDIDRTQSVYCLKMGIEEEKPLTLAAAAVRDLDLQLYHVNIPFDRSGEKEHIKQANERFQDLSNYKPLELLRKLSDIENGFPEGMVHILVRRPPSESIHSRACGAVAETTL
jgi:hypothetical protein